MQLVARTNTFINPTQALVRLQFQNGCTTQKAESMRQHCMVNAVTAFRSLLKSSVKKRVAVQHACGYLRQVCERQLPFIGLFLTIISEKSDSFFETGALDPPYFMIRKNTTARNIFLYHPHHHSLYGCERALVWRDGVVRVSKVFKDGIGILRAGERK